MFDSRDLEKFRAVACGYDTERRCFIIVQICFTEIVISLVLSAAEQEKIAQWYANIGKVILINNQVCAVLLDVYCQDVTSAELLDAAVKQWAETGSELVFDEVSELKVIGDTCDDCAFVVVDITYCVDEQQETIVITQFKNEVTRINELTQQYAGRVHWMKTDEHKYCVRIDGFRVVNDLTQFEEFDAELEEAGEDCEDCYVNVFTVKLCPDLKEERSFIIKALKKTKLDRLEELYLMKIYLFEGDGESFCAQITKIEQTIDKYEEKDYKLEYRQECKTCATYLVDCELHRYYLAIYNYELTGIGSGSTNSGTTFLLPAELRTGNYNVYDSQSNSSVPMTAIGGLEQEYRFMCWTKASEPENFEGDIIPSAKLIPVSSCDECEVLELSECNTHSTKYIRSTPQLKQYLGKAVKLSVEGKTSCYFVGSAFRFFVYEHQLLNNYQIIGYYDDCDQCYAGTYELTPCEDPKSCCSTGVEDSSGSSSSLYVTFKNLKTRLRDGTVVKVNGKCYVTKESDTQNAQTISNYEIFTSCDECIKKGLDRCVFLITGDNADWQKPAIYLFGFQEGRLVEQCTDTIPFKFDTVIKEISVCTHDGHPALCITKIKALVVGDEESSYIDGTTCDESSGSY